MLDQTVGTTGDLDVGQLLLGDPDGADAAVINGDAVFDVEAQGQTGGMSGNRGGTQGRPGVDAEAAVDADGNVIFVR